MINTLYGVYGASGLGRQIMPLARKMLYQQILDGAKLVFIDDGLFPPVLNGHEVWSWERFKNSPKHTKSVAIAIAQGRIRERLASKLEMNGVLPLSVTADSAEIMDEVVLGEGSLLSSFVLLTSNIKIGRYFHANHYSHVAHDCIIGDFVTFAPGVRCNGNVHIEDFVYVGTGAMLRQGSPDKPLRIGAGAVIGMGAVVTKDVPAGATVVGNPARQLDKN